MLTDAAGVVCDRLVEHVAVAIGHAVAQRAHAHAGEREHQRQEAFAPVEFVLDAELVLLPRRIVQRRGAMHEHVEERTRGAVAVVDLAVREHLGVVQRQRAGRTEQAGERRRDAHLADALRRQRVLDRGRPVQRHAVFGEGLDRLQFTGREGQRKHTNNAFMPVTFIH